MSGVLRPAPASTVLAVALALAGCGGTERSGDVRAPTASPAPATTPTPGAAAPAPTPTGSVPATTAPEPTSSAPATADPGGASAEESQPGGAGDEEAIRQPVRFTVDAGDITPASVSVAPFLAVALTVVNRSSVAHRVRLIGTGESLQVPAGGRAERRLPGLRAGMYTVSVDDGAAAASLLVGDDAGP